MDRLPSHVGARIECAGGRAAEFECKGVDLLSHLPKKDMGAEPRILVNDIWGWTDPETNQEYALGREGEQCSYSRRNRPGESGLSWARFHRMIPMPWRSGAT